MLTLNKLIFSGIGRFVEEQTIDFSELSSLVQVDGHNKNTGGSSGAGKSTIFNAVDFLLGLNDIPNGTLQSRLTKSGISVEGHFDWDEKPLIVKRTKKGLSITVSGQVIEGSSKLAEEKLDEILAIPRELFRQILHKRQNERGFFLKLTPKQCDEFLTDTLELGSLQEKIALLDGKAKERASQLATAENQLKIHQASLTATVNALASMGTPPVLTVTDEYIASLTASTELAQATLAQYTQKDLEETGAHDAARPKTSIAPFDRSLATTIEAKILGLTELAQGLSGAEITRQSQYRELLSQAKMDKMRQDALVTRGAVAKEEATKVGAEIKLIRESICPTCSQSWATEGAKKKEAELLEKIKVLMGIIAASQEAAAASAVLSSKITELEPEIMPKKVEGLDEILVQKQALAAELLADREKEKAHQSQEAARVSTIMNTWAAQSQAIAQRQAASTSHLRNELYKLQTSLSLAKNNQKSEKEAFERYNTQYYLNSTHIKRWESAVAETTESVNLAKDSLELIEDSKKAIKSFMSCSFDEALDQISETATGIIHQIPNMANATIRLQGTKETGKGAIKEEVNAVLNVDGEDEVPIRSLSGGERTSIDLAIDMAVIDLIQTKTNKGINIFVLDEPFNGLEEINIEPILELLRNSNIGKKVFVVDHNPKVKESITDRILVVRDGLESFLQK